MTKLGKPDFKSLYDAEENPVNTAESDITTAISYKNPYDIESELGLTLDHMVPEDQARLEVAVRQETIKKRVAAASHRGIHLSTSDPYKNTVKRIVHFFPALEKEQEELTVMLKLEEELPKVVIIAFALLFVKAIGEANPKLSTAFDIVLYIGLAALFIIAGRSIYYKHEFIRVTEIRSIPKNTREIADRVIGIIEDIETAIQQPERAANHCNEAANSLAEIRTRLHIEVPAGAFRGAAKLRIDTETIGESTNDDVYESPIDTHPTTVYQARRSLKKFLGDK